MRNVLYFVVYIKRRGGAKTLNPTTRTYTYMHLRICVER